MTSITREHAREMDRRAIEEFGVPSLVLMENAGRGAAELLVSLGVHGPVAICCGKGNNGGDGLVMARHLDNHGVKLEVHLFSLPEELTPDAAIHWQVITRSNIRARVWAKLDEESFVAALDRAEWAVDALFGTGLTGPVRSPFDEVIKLINASPVRVFAVDVPSGLDCDTGEPMGPTVRARHTASFIAPKKGYASPAAQRWLGKVHVVDIGLPRQLLCS